jgi:hypothetical protein
MKPYRILSNGQRDWYPSKHLKGVAGAYLLYQGTTCYVGSSKDLLVRLRSHHLRDWHFRAWPDKNYRAREKKLMEALLDAGVKLRNKNYSTG